MDFRLSEEQQHLQQKRELAADFATRSAHDRDASHPTKITSACDEGSWR